MQVDNHKLSKNDRSCSERPGLPADVDGAEVLGGAEGVSDQRGLGAKPGVGAYELSFSGAGEGIGAIGVPAVADIGFCCPPSMPNRSSSKGTASLLPSPDEGRDGGGGGLRNGNPADAEPARGGGARTGATGDGGAGHRRPLDSEA